jgi:hypothetical protein
MGLRIYFMEPRPSQRRALEILPNSHCVYMCILLSLLGNGLLKTLLRQTVHSNSIRIVGRVVCYAIRVVSRKVCNYFSPELVIASYGLSLTSRLTRQNILILGVCILLRVWDQGEGFPSTQPYFNSFLLFYSTSRYMFRSYDHIQVEINTTETCSG